VDVFAGLVEFCNVVSLVKFLGCTFVVVYLSKDTPISCSLRLLETFFRFHAVEMSNRSVMMLSSFLPIEMSTVEIFVKVVAQSMT
jgi:hypothetical protein